MNGAISVKDIVRTYLASKSGKDWGGHDRASTVGASDIVEPGTRFGFHGRRCPQFPKQRRLCQHGGKFRTAFLTLAEMRFPEVLRGCVLSSRFRRGFREYLF